MKLSLVHALAPLVVATSSHAEALDCAYPAGSGTDCPDAMFCQIDANTCGSLDPDAAIQGTCAIKPEACTMNYAPVCGCDGVTYGNECAARSAGMNVDYEGECPTPCEFPAGDDACPSGQLCKIDSGVCGSLADEETVGGVCEAMPQMCTANYAPVCGCDGNTYANECSALGAGANVDYEGACEGDYCNYEPDADCWISGHPQCCDGGNDQPCPPDRVPRCDNNDATGWDYCTWSPDRECYPSNNGWPECCARFDGTNCPPDPPNCENPLENIDDERRSKYLRAVD